MEEFPVKNRPKIVLFDMDFTVWPYWADCHLDPPFSLKKGVIRDSSNATVVTYPDIPRILKFCQHHNLTMAVASKSPECQMYQELMKLMDIHKYFVQFEIYHKRKVHHMRAISEKQGISYNDMIFFDDEWKNISDTREMGVTAIHCPNRAGLTWDIFIDALKKHDIDVKHR